MNKLMKFLKPLIWIVAIAFFIIATLPKEQLYFKLEQTILKNNEIIIYDETTTNSLLSLKIKDAMISYKGIDAAYLQNLNIFSVLFFTKIDLKSLKINKSIQNIIPANINKLEILHNIFMPHLVDINAELKVGTLVGEVNLLNKTINLKLEVKGKIEPSERRVLNFMEKSKTQKGVYTYEYSF